MLGNREMGKIPGESAVGGSPPAVPSLAACKARRHSPPRSDASCRGEGGCRDLLQLRLSDSEMCLIVQKKLHFPVSLAAQGNKQLADLNRPG